MRPYKVSKIRKQIGAANLSRSNPFKWILTRGDRNVHLSKAKANLFSSFIALDKLNLDEES